MTLSSITSVNSPSRSFANRLQFSTVQSSGTEPVAAITLLRRIGWVPNDLPLIVRFDRNGILLS